MQEQIPHIYQVPLLFYLVCFFAAASFVVSSWLWFARAYKNGVSFSSFIWIGQGRAVVFVAFISLCIGLYDSLQYASPLRWKGEVLLILFWIYIRSYKEGHTLVSMFRILMRSAAHGLMCILLFMVSFGAAYLIFILSHSLMVAVMISAGSWVVPILVLYYRLSKGGAMMAHKKGLHHYLWPILFAYIALMTPLLIQNIANSEEWNEMKRAKPMRQA